MRLKEKKYFKNLPPPLKKFSAQGAKKVDYGISRSPKVGSTKTFTEATTYNTHYEPSRLDMRYLQI